MQYLLMPIGVACVIAAIVHGYLGQAKLIGPAAYTHKWAKGFVGMIWQYSTVTWAMIGAFIAVSPWLVPREDLSWAVPLACSPILYGVAGNFLVSGGRHFGWMIFAVIIAAATLVANL
ncbi:MAG TPA: hypothetical protein PLR76_00130 [Hyphomonas sp.]|nr:hypothetical protein [Hyphomonas sp.]MCC0017766.1 hypothetical protein [Rhodobiaceae bacterium]HPE46765.1 hypothetical protein [Hyphomonas sp.]